MEGVELCKENKNAERIFRPGLSKFHKEPFDSSKGKHKNRFSYFEKLEDSYRRTRFDSFRSNKFDPFWLILSVTSRPR